MKNMKRYLKRYAIVALVAIVLFISKYANESSDNKVMTYNEVIKELDACNIERFKVNEAMKNVTVIMNNETEKKAKVPNISEFINFISNKIEEGSDVKIDVTKDLGLSNLIYPISLLIIFNVFMRKQMQGGKFDFGQSKSNVTFDDIAGIEEVKEQIEDIIDYFKNPDKYKDNGARIPKGIILSGEPGNGKTLLAKAMSAEAGVEFFQVTGSSFEERLVGVGASRVRQLFNKAKKSAPAIIFIDEIDSIAQNRNIENSYNAQTLNQLLAEMDGFESSDNIVVIAATNRIEILDDAILRPGRFDRKIYIPNPDVRARQLILELHARDKKISSEVSFQSIAQRTVGFSGANLENILNEAAIYSVKNDKEEIDNEAIEEAIAMVIVGLKKKYSVMTPEEKHRTAIHESAHAIVSAVVRTEIQNFCISIVPRGRAGGYNFFNDSGKLYKSREELLKEMQVLYGGRIAEEVILKDISTGAANDLEKASKIALYMVSKYGMENSHLVKIKNESKYNELIEKKSIEEAEHICTKAYAETINIVKMHQPQIEKLAAVLEEKEYLDQEDVSNFMSNNIQ